MTRPVLGILGIFVLIVGLWGLVAGPILLGGVKGLALALAVVAVGGFMLAAAT